MDGNVLILQKAPTLLTTFRCIAMIRNWLRVLGIQFPFAPLALFCTVTYHKAPMPSLHHSYCLSLKDQRAIDAISGCTLSSSLKILLPLCLEEKS